MGWTSKVVVPPPEIQKEKEFCFPRIKAWVNFHPGAGGKEVACKIVKNIRLVCKNEFDEALERSVVSFDQARAGRDYIAIVTDTGSSNLWMFEKALPFLSKPPVEVAHYFELKEALTKFPSVKDLVIFDDAAYSCQQIRSYTRVALSNIDTTGGNVDEYRIHTVLPFKTGCSTAYGSVGERVTVTDHVAETVPQISELGLDRISERYSPYNIQNNVLLVLPHKIADSFSVPRNIFRGLVGQDPDVKNAPWERKRKWTGSFFKEPYLRPPYKSEDYLAAHKNEECLTIPLAT